MLCYAASMTASGPKVRITVDGKIALTVEWAAARFGVEPKSLSGELSRHKDAITHVAMLDGKKKLYLQRDLDSWWKSRRGRGWRAKTDGA